MMMHLASRHLSPTARRTLVLLFGTVLVIGIGLYAAFVA